MSAPWSILATLNFPGAPSLPAQGVPANVTGAFDQNAIAEFDLVGTGTKVVGNLPSSGAKALLIHLEAGVGVAPVLVTLNGANMPIEISSGGFIIIANPAPTAGVTTISIAHTAACTVRVWALG
jgi:hypothetical protein